MLKDIFRDFFRYPLVKQGYTEEGVLYYELDVKGELTTIRVYEENDDAFVKQILLCKDHSFESDEVFADMLSYLRCPQWYSHSFKKIEGRGNDLDFYDYIEKFKSEGDHEIWYLTKIEWLEVLEYFEIDEAKKISLFKELWLEADRFGSGITIQILNIACPYGLDFTNRFEHPQFDDVFIMDTDGDVELHKLIDNRYLVSEVRVGGRFYQIF